MKQIYFAQFGHTRVLYLLEDITHSLISIVFIHLNRLCLDIYLGQCMFLEG